VPVGLISVTLRSGSNVWSIVRLTFTSRTPPDKPVTGMLDVTGRRSPVLGLGSGIGSGTSVALKLALPESSLPLLFRSWNTVQPDNGGSPASRTPLALRSSNTEPEMDDGTATEF